MVPRVVVVGYGFECLLYEEAEFFRVFTLSAAGSGYIDRVLGPERRDLHVSELESAVHVIRCQI